MFCLTCVLSTCSWSLITACLLSSSPWPMSLTILIFYINAYSNWRSQTYLISSCLLSFMTRISLTTSCFLSPPTSCRRPARCSTPRQRATIRAWMLLEKHAFGNQITSTSGGWMLVSIMAAMAASRSSGMWWIALWTVSNSDTFLENCKTETPRSYLAWWLLNMSFHWFI